MRLSFLLSSYRYCHKSLSLHLPPATKLAASAAKLPPRRTATMDHSATVNRRYFQNCRLQKIVVIMGPTGSGKSRLSIDLATRFFPSEVINSDKIQVYRGLDITTNKIPMHERLGVPHHLIGDFDPSDCRPEFTPSDFRSAADSAISDIASRRKLPLIVGGSNSFIYALAASQLDPKSGDFDEKRPGRICSELRYDCCFLRVDVSFPVLNHYLIKRVDEMLDSGMFEELAEFFNSEGFTESVPEMAPLGLRKAIGVPEFEGYFRNFRTDGTDFKGDPIRRRAFEEAVGAIKDNTCQLASRQVGKILRLRGAGWNMQRLDATKAFRAAMAEAEGSYFGETASEIWERQVLEPSVKIVKQFLDE